MYTKPRAARALQIGAVVLTLVSLSCNSLTSFGGVYTPVITNDTDAYAFKATLSNITRREEDRWQNTGVAANVTLSNAVTGGTATLSIMDADGALVYTHALDGSGPGGTGPGSAGLWTIVVEMTNTTGTLDFKVEKP